MSVVAQTVARVLTPVRLMKISAESLNSSRFVQELLRAHESLRSHDSDRLGNSDWSHYNTVYTKVHNAD